MKHYLYRYMVLNLRWPGDISIIRVKRTLGKGVNMGLGGYMCLKCQREVKSDRSETQVTTGKGIE